MFVFKSICEVRFDDSFYFDEGKTKSDLSKMLRGDYANSSYDDAQKAMFFANENLNERFVIFKNRIIADIEQPGTLAKIKSNAANSTQRVMERLGVETSNRVGIRAYFLDENFNGVTQTSERIVRKFFGNSLQSFIHSHTNEDGGYRPSVSFHIKANHEFNMNFNVGAHQVGTGRIDEVGEIKLTKIEKINPMLDIDIYTTEPKSPNQINGVIKAALSYLERYSKEVWDMEG